MKLVKWWREDWQDNNSGNNIKKTKYFGTKHKQGQQMFIRKSICTKRTQYPTIQKAFDERNAKKMVEDGKIANRQQILKYQFSFRFLKHVIYFP